MRDYEKNLQKLAKEIKRTIETDEKLREILEKFLDDNFEISITRISNRKLSERKNSKANDSLIVISAKDDLAMEVKKCVRENLNLTPEDHLFLKSIKIKSDE